MTRRSAPAATWVIDRFENGAAVLVRGKETLVVSRDQLSKSCREGDIVTAEFFLLKEERSRREGRARALLEELLSTDQN